MGQADSVFEQIAAEIVKSIEAGGVGTWSMPWRRLNVGMPTNASTGRSYSGGNVLALWIMEHVAGHPTSQWATYKQWQAMDAQVRKGERGTHLVKWVERKCKDHGPGEQCLRCGSMFPVGFVVFNAAQVDGYEAPPVVELPEQERIAAAEAFFASIGADIREGGDAAKYVRTLDYIAVPTIDQFSDPADFYSTLAHESTHWTGHEDRLNRTFGKRFGDDLYAAEELVAELGAAFLCAHLGISNVPRPDHAQYLAGWLRVLKAEPRALFEAASKASKAASFLIEQQPATTAEVAA